MMAFLFKGVIRDKSRSVFPFLTILIGVFLTVGIYCYIKGVEYGVIKFNANLQTGHVKVMTRAYLKEADQIPNDLALTGVDALLTDLRQRDPELSWTPRIRFGGLLDIPDENGETRVQSPVTGLAVDLLTPGSAEPRRLDIGKALVRGGFPKNPGDILISEELARKLGIGPGDKATFIGSTMHGSMAMKNFRIAGTVRFGFRALDLTGLIADLGDARDALDMEDAAGEVLGFFEHAPYEQKRADEIARSFNARFQDKTDEFLPEMVTLRDQNGLGAILSQVKYTLAIIIAIFLGAMSLVLWNAGLIGSLRRYGEIGLRLAVGEDKGHVYRSMIMESLMIGALGSAAGTLLGLALSYYLQAKGINIASLVKNASLMIPTVLNSRVTSFSYVIGFIPGLLATLVGTSIAGLGIFKRQTSQLFKELET